MAREDVHVYVKQATDVLVFLAQKIKGAVLIRLSRLRFPTWVQAVTTEEASLQTEAIRGGLHHTCRSEELPSLQNTIFLASVHGSISSFAGKSCTSSSIIKDILKFVVCLTMTEPGGLKVEHFHLRRR